VIIALYPFEFLVVLSSMELVKYQSYRSSEKLFGFFFSKQSVRLYSRNGLGV
jgi:hypothetical protein